ncbi:prenyltransferase [Anaerorudis cellulosivorans]|uniref:prenyltransferase n=1 Tax=Anaerorudis cellulosivorans TaxID=3397862 RepID=UPI00221F8A2B|nr:prenyltransferase [Seramator thermalis]MCW1735380.1 prenyltransferase [Seramator thermalis]
MGKERKISDWIIATRPWSFPASTMPALVTISYVYFLKNEIASDINWFYGVLAFIGACIFQASGNLIGDYFDFKYGVDRKESFGSSRMLVDRIFSPKTILNYGIVMLAIGILLGLFLFVRTGTDLLWIGGIGVLATFFYYKLKFAAFGDLVIFIVYGPLIGLGTAFVMTNQLMWNVVLLNIPIAFLVVNILHANNMRDIRDDGKAHIRTQAMVLGMERAKVQYLILAVGAYVGVILMVVFGMVHPLTLIVFLSLPVELKNLKQMKKAEVENPEFIKNLDANSAQLVLIFSFLFAVANFFAAGL